MIEIVPPILRFCYHEAGHAAAALLYGFTPRLVWADPVAGGRCYSDWPTTPLANATSIMAGTVAEILYGELTDDATHARNLESALAHETPLQARLAEDADKNPIGAGALAITDSTSETRSTESRARSDWMQLCDLAEERGEPVYVVNRAGHRNAMRLLKDNWRLVVAIATALMERGALGGAAIESLRDSARGGTNTPPAGFPSGAI